MLIKVQCVLHQHAGSTNKWKPFFNFLNHVRINYNFLKIIVVLVGNNA